MIFCKIGIELYRRLDSYEYENRTAGVKLFIFNQNALSNRIRTGVFIM